MFYLHISLSIMTLLSLNHECFKFILFLSHRVISDSQNFTTKPYQIQLTKTESQQMCDVVFLLHLLFFSSVFNISKFLFHAHSLNGLEESGF